MIDAVVVKVLPSNFQVIISEGGVPRDFEGSPTAFLEEWLADNPCGGYFIREEGCAWDCTLLRMDVFDELYSLDTHSPDQLFVKIIKR